MPMRGELSIPATRSSIRTLVSNKQSWLFALYSNHDLTAVLLFSVIGLLVAVDMVLRFPEIGNTATDVLGMN